MQHPKSLDDFIAEIPVEEIVHAISSGGRLSAELARQKLVTYINETRVALELVAPLLNPNQRILEVGAGLCLFSLYLKQAGYDIWALEPSIGGFGFFADLKAHVLDHYQGLHLPVIEHLAEEAMPERDGTFDLIFSVNVMEHIPDYEIALCRLSRCLRRDGVMVHGCPNYRIPYEPHFNIPVLKPWPNLSERLFRSRIAPRQDLWDSLNFISAKDVRRTARQCDMQVSFRPGLLFQAVKRLEEDAEFARRHGSLIAVMVSIVKMTGLMSALKHAPPAWATPMMFEMRLKN